MRYAFTLLLLIPSGLVDQQGAQPEPVNLEIRSADSSRVLSVRIDLSGQLLARVGVLQPAQGTVEMAGPGGVAATPALMQLGTRTGNVNLKVAESGPELEVSVIAAGALEPRVIVRGHSVSFSRNEAGHLLIHARGITTRF